MEEGKKERRKKGGDEGRKKQRRKKIRKEGRKDYYQ